MIFVYLAIRVAFIVRPVSRVTSFLLTFFEGVLKGFVSTNTVIAIRFNVTFIFPKWSTIEERKATKLQHRTFNKNAFYLILNKQNLVYS